MYVKGHKKTIGIPAAEVRVVAGHADIFLAGQVVVLLKLAETGIVVSSLRLSVAETRELARELLAQADAAAVI